MDDLTDLIARRRRQDQWFNLLGIGCTLLGILTLGILLFDLVIDTLALAANARKSYPALPAEAVYLQDDRLTIKLENLTIPTPVTGPAAKRLAGRSPRVVQLRGKNLLLVWGERERLIIPLTEDQSEVLTGKDSFLGRLTNALGVFFTSFPSRRPSDAGILSAWVGTLCVILVTALLAVPLGVGAGIYLEEYAGRNWLTSLIEINISNLAGVPSILYGLLALGVLVYTLQLDRSILTGAITLAILILPIVIVATREALRAVPLSIREAAFALGATRWQVVRHHLLPYSASGISTGVIIGLSRAIGETAPLVTIGALTFIAFLPPAPLQDTPPYVSADWLWSPFTVLPIQMFNWVSRPGNDFRANAAAAGLILIVITLGLNSLAIWLRYRLRRRIKW